MLIKILSLGDILSIIALISLPVLPISLVMLMGLYLIIKGITFSLMGNLVSLIDGLAGFYILIAVFGISHWIPTLIVSIFILQKAIPPIFT